MCLYPRLIKNPRYLPNKKNGGHPAKARDPRLLYVSVGCGNCIECRKQKARNWQIRLSQELQENPNAYFVTLTFSEEKLNWFQLTTKNENETATAAVRYFLERWRKKYKKSVKHWLITELGHDNTERLHLHGIIWCTNEQIKELEKIWSYGWVYIGNYCNERTINYIIKYVTKIDNDHKDFTGKILCSKGLGNGYLKKAKLNIFDGTNTKEYIIAKNGAKIALPMYYRNHIYNDDQREKLWINKLNKNERYIMGTRYDLNIKNGIHEYLKALKTAQRDNIKMGYSGINWKSDNYKETLKKLNKC